MNQTTDISFIEALCIVGQSRSENRDVPWRNDDRVNDLAGIPWHNDLVNALAGTHRNTGVWSYPDVITHRLPFLIYKEDFEAECLQAANDAEDYLHHFRANETGIRPPHHAMALSGVDEYVRHPLFADNLLVKADVFETYPGEDAFKITPDQIRLLYGSYHILIDYLAAANNPKRFILQSLDGEKAPTFNPFDHKHFERNYMLDAPASKISSPNTAFIVTVRRKHLREYLATGKITQKKPPKPDSNQIDSDSFIELMRESMWDRSNAPIIGRQGGFKNYTNIIAKKYEDMYPHHAGKNYTNNKPIQRAFKKIKEKIMYETPAEPGYLTDVELKFIEWLARTDYKYKWRWHLVLGFKKGTTKEQAAQAFIAFMKELTETWRYYKRVQESKIWTNTSEIPRLVIMEKESAGGYLHFHVCFGDEIVKSMKGGIASLWEKTAIIGDNGKPYYRCERPKDNEDGTWFEKIYSVYGLTCYVLKEKNFGHLPDVVTDLAEGITLLPEDIGFD